jgi:FkbM family methyltransferase
MMDQRNRMILNGRPAYQGKKIKRAIDLTLLHKTLTPADELVAIDVGAHIGLWAYNLAHAFTEVHCFEPVEAHRACFEKNVLATDVAVMAKTIELYPFALGDHEDMISIHTGPASSGDSRVLGKGTIPMKMLDSFAIEPDLIKIDCEGYEEFVLRGGEKMIRRCQPVIVVEQKRDFATRYDLKPQGAVEYLKKLGYTQADEIGGDYFMVYGRKA